MLTMDNYLTGDSDAYFDVDEKASPQPNSGGLGRSSQSVYDSDVDCIPESPLSAIEDGVTLSNGKSQDSSLSHNVENVLKRANPPVVKNTQSRRRFHNLSLRNIPDLVKDASRGCCGANKASNLTKDPVYSTGTNNFIKPDALPKAQNFTTYRSNLKSDDSGSDSETAENFLSQLRESQTQNLPPCPKGHSDSSFVVSDSESLKSSTSGSSDDLTFYRRLDNERLKKAIKKVTPFRRRVRLESPDISEEDNESLKFPKAHSESGRDSPKFQSDSEEEEIRSKPPVLVLTRESQLVSIPKKDVHLKEAGNVSTRDESSLPFIYSLDPWDRKTGRPRHPSAERFVKNFKKNREELSNRLLKFYNEVVFDNKLPSDLRVTWNERLVKTAGQCLYRRRNTIHGDGSRTTKCEVQLELSGKVCTSAERVRDTLLHEACHAAVWLVHGVNDGHGRLWRAFTARAAAALPGLPPVSVRHSYSIDARFVYICSGCCATIKRHSKSIDTNHKVCGHCRSRFKLFVNRRGKLVEVETPSSSTPTPAPPSTGNSGATSGIYSFPSDSGSSNCVVPATPRARPAFADFVKEHYKEVRSSTSSHKEAMTQLGSLFRSMRIDNQNKEN